MESIVVFNSVSVVVKKVCR